MHHKILLSDEFREKIVLNKKLLRFYLFFLHLISFLCFSWLLLIPADEKNAIFLGYSTNRWALIVLMLGIMLPFLIDGWLSQRLITNIAKVVQSWFVKFHPRWFVEFFAFLLYLVLFYPTDRVLSLSAYVVRVRPLLIFIVLLLVGIFLVSFCTDKHHHAVWVFIKYHWQVHKKETLRGLMALLAFVGLFFLLRISHTSAHWSNLIFSVGPPLLPTQGILLVALFVIGTEVVVAFRQEQSMQKTIITLIFVALWLLSFVILLNTAFVCQGDRPGPFPPNYRCYPEVHDASYAIGSHYTALGKGVNNLWYTDKPLYLVVLAFGQFVFGPTIDRYLLFQIALVALTPAFLFYLGNKLTNLVGGTFLAALSLVMEVNNIRMYGSAGGVNVYLLNTELLTGLLLVILCVCLFEYSQNLNADYWLILSGILLALSSLTRLNGLFLVPAILGYIFLLNRARRHKPLLALVLCLTAFCLVFLPAQLSLRDETGTPHFVDKFEDVIRFRYISPATNPPQALDAQSAYPLAGSTWFHAPASLAAVRFFGSLPLSFALGQPARVDQAPANLMLVNQSPVWFQNFSSIALIFINNLYQSLLKLPVNFRLLSPSTTLKQPLLASSAGTMVWDKPISLENALAFIFNGGIVLFGSVDLIRRRSRWGGVVPAIFFLVYHGSNAMAMTAGDRYLQPVSWIILLWFVAGIQIILRLTANAIPGGIAATSHRYDIMVNGMSGSNIIVGKPQKSMLYFALSVLLLVSCGLLFPLLNRNTNDLATIDEKLLPVVAAELIQYHSPQSYEMAAGWLNDPNIIVVEGLAFHPRQYPSPIVFLTDEIFELTVLGDARVYISNYFGSYDPTSFGDGSRVVLIGCKIRDTTFWNIDHTIMRTYAILQLDNEQTIYLNPYFRFPCE